MEVYLDNAATTRPYDEVLDYMDNVSRLYYGNPSSLHRKGIEAEKLIKRARETLADSLGVLSKEIYFTSGGTESINTALKGYLEANQRKGRHIITSEIEHPATLETCRQLEEKGFIVDYIGVGADGVIKLNELEDKLNEDTALISIMLVNNETGAIQPIDKIAAVKRAKNNNTVLHVDAVQGYGKLDIRPEKSGIDLLSLSSHKIHGPKGVGALYVDKNIKIKPIIFGGGQETLLRSGTENVPGICGFGLAAEKAYTEIENSALKIGSLKELFINLIKDSDIGEYMILSNENASPYIINIAFADTKSEVMLHHLEEKGIFVSAGSACSSKKKKHSHVLTAMNVKQREIEGAIRFSFSIFNNEKEILYTIEAIKEILPKIRIRHGGKR